MHVPAPRVGERGFQRRRYLGWRRLGGQVSNPSGNRKRVCGIHFSITFFGIIEVGLLLTQVGDSQEVTKFVDLLFD